MTGDSGKKDSLLKKIAETQVWKSIFRTGIPKNRRPETAVRSGRTERLSAPH